MRDNILFLAILLVQSFVLVGCDDSNNNSGNTFTEDQFADDITLRANPETDTVVKFLEPPIPIPVVNTRDTLLVQTEQRSHKSCQRRNEKFQQLKDKAISNIVNQLMAFKNELGA